MNIYIPEYKCTYKKFYNINLIKAGRESISNKCLFPYLASMFPPTKNLKTNYLCLGSTGSQHQTQCCGGSSLAALVRSGKIASQPEIRKE